MSLCEQVANGCLYPWSKLHKHWGSDFVHLISSGVQAIIKILNILTKYWWLNEWRTMLPSKHFWLESVVLRDLLLWKNRTMSCQIPACTTHNRPHAQQIDHRPTPMPRGRCMGVLYQSGALLHRKSTLFQHVLLRPHRKGSPDVDLLWIFLIHSEPWIGTLVIH